MIDMTITVKTIKGTRYLYFSCYDRDSGGVKYRSCGAESKPESRRKVELLEREHLTKRLQVLEAESSRIRSKLEALGGS